VTTIATKQQQQHQCRVTSEARLRITVTSVERYLAEPGGRRRRSSLAGFIPRVHCQRAA